MNTGEILDYTMTRLQSTNTLPRKNEYKDAKEEMTLFDNSNTLWMYSINGIASKCDNIDNDDDKHDKGVAALDLRTTTTGSIVEESTQTNDASTGGNNYKKLQISYKKIVRS